MASTTGKDGRMLTITQVHKYKNEFIPFLVTAYSCLVKGYDDPPINGIILPSRCHKSVVLTGLASLSNYFQLHEEIADLSRMSLTIRAL